MKGKSKSFKSVCVQDDRDSWKLLTNHILTLSNLVLLPSSAAPFLTDGVVCDEH